MASATWTYWGNLDETHDATSVIGVAAGVCPIGHSILITDAEYAVLSERYVLKPGSVPWTRTDFPWPQQGGAIGVPSVPPGLAADYFAHKAATMSVHGIADTSKLTALGWLDITQPPYNADKTGVADCTAIIQQAITDAVTANGATIYFPRGTYLMSSSFTAPGNGQVNFPDRSELLPQICVRLKGETPPAQVLWAPAVGVDTPAYSGGSVIKSTNTTGGHIFACNTHAMAGIGNFTNLHPMFEDLTILAPNNPNIGGLQLNGAWSAQLNRVTVGVNASSLSIAAPTHGTRAIQLPLANNAALVEARSVQTFGFADGLHHSEHALLDNFNGYLHVNAIVQETAFHVSTYNRVMLQDCNCHMNPAGSCVIRGTVGLQDKSSGWWALGSFNVNDPSLRLHGIIDYARYGNAGTAQAALVNGGTNLTLNRLI